MAILLKSMYVGLPQKLGRDDPQDRFDQAWESAIYKKRRSGHIWLGKTNLQGDGQADLVHHGGPDKAVFAYPEAHYSYWQTYTGNEGIKPGGMGENFSLQNQSETEVAIGDTYEIGEAIIQVSQPRQPCWKPARRFRNKDLGLQQQSTGKTGWYYRVLREGYVQAGQALLLIERPYPSWTVAQCNKIMHEEIFGEELRELARCSLLSESWKKTLQERHTTGLVASSQNRLFGPNE